MKKLLWPVTSQGMLEQAKKTWRFQTPARLSRILLKAPQRVVNEDLTDEGHN